MATDSERARRSLKLPRATIRTDWVKEPCLGFASGFAHHDPQVGIALTGPASFGTDQHPTRVRVGIIGTAEGIELARRYLDTLRLGVDVDIDNDGAADLAHNPFPGFNKNKSFRTELATPADLAQKLTQREVQRFLEPGRRQRERFEDLLATIMDRADAIAQADHPPHLVLIILPDDLIRRCGTADHREDGVSVHRDLHASLKASMMPLRLPSQILKESTTRLTDRRVDLEPPPEVAWNLATALYFKAGGYPWRPLDLEPGSCFVGVSFFRPHGERGRLRTCVAQAFSETGNALVLRGLDFKFTDRTPHLPAAVAADLMQRTLERYKREFGRAPGRVVIHKSSTFTASERSGFLEGLGEVPTDMVALRQSHDLKLMRLGRRPPLRGTLVDVGNRRFLYTTGYLPQLGRYPHGHVPAPLEVAEHQGDTAPIDTIRELMTLTKMNWNTARFAEHMPITLRFSRFVGHVLRELDDDPIQSRYAFYM